MSVLVSRDHNNNSLASISVSSDCDVSNCVGARPNKARCVAVLVRLTKPNHTGDLLPGFSCTIPLGPANKPIPCSITTKSHRKGRHYPDDLLLLLSRQEPMSPVCRYTGGWNNKRKSLDKPNPSHLAHWCRQLRRVFHANASPKTLSRNQGRTKLSNNVSDKSRRHTFAQEARSATFQIGLTNCETHMP